MSAKHTPGPWKACRAHEDYEGPYFDIGPEDRAEYDARPFTSIKAPTGTIFTAHDLFEFRGDEGAANAARIVDCVNACEGMDAPAAEIARLRNRDQLFDMRSDDLREALDALEGLYARLNRPDDATDARAILTKHGRAV